MVLILWLISIIAFVIIELPPGDYLTTYVASLQTSGIEVDEEHVRALEEQYGFNSPFHTRYFKWVWNMLQGDFGRSFEWRRPVGELLAERVPLTILISLVTMVFTYAVAIPVGIYSAVRQYSVGDYAATVLGFIGLATPNFLIALVLMIAFSKWFGVSPGGLFSTEFQLAPWSLAKVWDLLKHLPVPIIVIGTAGTAGLIRVMRGCLLDELEKQYVTTARSKGVEERRLLFKYPVRVAMNPIISTLGWTLPLIVSGETITAIVLNLPTTGPLLFNALLSQDMYLAGATVMLLAFLTVVGTFLSDLLLVWADPRIRFD
jgi:peptide/nickel transport system permease protein